MINWDLHIIFGIGVLIIFAIRYYNDWNDYNYNLECDLK